MSCPTVTTIQKTECIGNSLVTINSNFDTLKQAVCDNFDLIQSLLPSFAGMIAYFPSITAPLGWLELNGSLISRAAYSNLWTFASNSGNITTTDANWFSLSALGQFSPGDGSTTFRLPNLRGTFLRGSGTLNPSVSSGTFGRFQTDAFRSHNHGGITGNDSPDHTHAQNSGNPYRIGFGDGSSQFYYTPRFFGDSGSGSSAGIISTGGASTRHQHTISPQGDTETRPHNVALLPCIKY